MNKKQKGFTIVELLIVIVVIGILAAITIAAFNGVSDRAQQNKMTHDISEIKRAIIAARAAKGTTMQGITGSYGTGGTCWGKATGTDLASLPPTDSCITNYNAALTAINNAAGSNLPDLRDPWGRPYLLDENEGEGGGCSKDTVAAYKYPFTTGFGAYTTTPTYTLALTGATGC